MLGPRARQAPNRSLSRLRGRAGVGVSPRARSFVRIRVVASAARPLLAVQMRKLRLRIAAPRGGAGRKSLGKRRQMRRRQLYIERTERLGEAVATPRADQRDDICALRRYPGDSDLRR